MPQTPVPVATLVRHRNLFSLQFYDKDRKPARKKVALRTTDRRLALQLQRKLETAYLECRFDPWRDDPRTLERKGAGAVSMSDALALFLKAKRQSGRAANTVRAYRDAVGLWTRTVGEATPLKALTSADIRTFIHDNGVSPTTQAFRYRHVRAFVRWLRREKMLSRDLLDGIDAPRKVETAPKAVAKAELDAICEAVCAIGADRLASGGCRAGEVVWRIPLFRFAYFTGMRMSELARLRWRDIDLDRASLTISRQKNRRAQTLPLVRPAIAVLRELGQRDLNSYVFGTPICPADRSTRQFVNGASRAFKEARERAGITRKVTPHGLRHAYCSRLAEAGKSAFVIREAARHADISTSLRYVSLASETLRSELADVFEDS